MSKIEFSGAYAQQSPEHCVLTFAATAKQVLSFSTIERVALKSSSPLTLYYRTSFPPVAGPSSSGDRISVSDVQQAFRSQETLRLVLDITSATAAFTLVLYGT